LALAGVKRLGSSLVLIQGLQLVAFLLMVRYLTVAEMGVVALIAAIYSGLEATTSLGFDKFLLYCDERESQEDVYSVVWTMQIVRGMSILLLALGAAKIIPSFFEGMTSLGAMIVAVGCAFVIMSFKNTWVASFERSKDFSVVAKINTASSVLKGLAVCCVVIVYQSPWAYVVGQIVGASAVTISSFLYVNRKPYFLINGDIIEEVFKYSKHLIVIALVSFIAAQFEVFYVGLTINAATLGLYFTWYRMSKLPRVLMNNLSGRVLFSKASELRRAGISVIESYHRCGFLFSMVIMSPFYVFLFFHGEFLLSVLSVNKYDGTQWLGQYVVLINWLFLLSMTMAPFMLVYIPALASKLRVFEAIILVGLVVILGDIFGLKGILIASLVSIFIAVLFRIYVLVTRFYFLKYPYYLWHLAKLIIFIVSPVIIFEGLICEFENHVDSIPLHLLFYIVYYLVGIAVVISEYKLLLRNE